MQKVLVSASHFDTLCRDAYQLLEANGYQVLFDPARSFPAYTTQELENHPDREDIVAALIGMDDFRDEGKFKALPNLKAVAKFGVGVDNIDGEMAKRYGFIYVEKYDDGPGSLARRTKKSVDWYKNLIATNGAEL